MQKKYIYVLASFFLLISVILFGTYYQNKNHINMSYTDFINTVENKRIEQVTFTSNQNTFQVTLKDDNKHIYIIPNPKTQDFTEYLLLQDITINYGKDGLVSGNLLLILIVLFAAGGAYYFRYRNQKSMIQNANKKSSKSSSITLKQVAGNIEAKSMLEDVISFIKEPDKYSSVGARMPKGVLLYGPPGTGKTLLAKAVAGEANVPFYAMSGSDFVQMYVGVGASRIRSLFQKAKKSEKAVIFIDEIDAIGKKRSRGASSSNDERDQTLNALLTEMSGFHENSGIIVIGATNRLDTLDEALLRPGRFDRQIEIGLPDVNSRKKILTLHAKTKPLADNIDLDALAKSLSLIHI